MDDEKKPAGDEQDMIRWLYAQSDRPQTTNVLSLVGPALLVHPQREQIMALHQQGVPLTMRPMAPHPDDQDDYLQVYIERDDEFYSVLRFPFSALRHVESGGGSLTGSQT